MVVRASGARDAAPSGPHSGGRTVRPMQRFPVIVGPTAGGKSALALALAQRLARCGDGCPAGAEIVSADAFQVYRGMDIGTAKPAQAERAQTPHRLIDICEPTEPFSVDRWLRLAEGAIAEAHAHDRTPIVVGGTLLYVMALLEGLFEGPGADESWRRAARERSTEDLRAELERLDPATARRIHPSDRRRAIRALEVLRATGEPLSQRQQQWDRGRRRRDALLVALSWPRERINRRINARVRAMLDAGLVEEVRRLIEADRLGPQAREAIGYREIAASLRGERSLEEAIERMKIETRRLAKRQRSWIRRLLAGAPPGTSLVIHVDDTPEERWPALVAEALAQPTPAR